jgi:hypothetical protein
MVKAQNGSAVVTFTCEEWKRLKAGHMWEEIENTCGDVFNSLFTPFASSAGNQQIQIQNIRIPQQHVFSGADFIGADYQIPSSIIVNNDWQQNTMLFAAKFMYPILDYSINSGTQTLTLVSPSEVIPWQVYLLVYFKKV